MSTESTRYKICSPNVMPFRSLLELPVASVSSSDSTASLSTFQAQENTMGSEHPKEPGGIKEGGSPPASLIGNKGCGASGGYMTRVVVVHGVSCRQGMGDIVAAARSMRFGGSRRLLGPGG